MYTAHSPTLSASGHNQLNSSPNSMFHTPSHSPRAFSSSYSGAAPGQFGSMAHHYQKSTQCLRFKYFTTFFICTTCLALLAASLATHKWLVSKPIRVLRLNGHQQANFTALILTAAQEAERADETLAGSKQARLMSIQQQQSSADNQQQVANLFASDGSQTFGASPSGVSLAGGAGSKFQGEIYFGLFNGVKVLNHGFGGRVSPLSVTQPFFNKETSKQAQPANELINFKFWALTLLGVVTAIIFALIGSIFAIINFVMTPRGTLSGPVGLVIWNASACFACLIAIFTWLIEYYLRLKSNVLTPEEVLNGWTSENRSQFGYSYYFVVLAFVLHLVNIFIVSLVQFETWTSHKAAKRHLQSSRHSSACEGVIMLY